VFRSNTTGFIDVFRGERIAPIRVLCFRRVLFRRESHAGVRARSLALAASLLCILMRSAPVELCDTAEIAAAVFSSSLSLGTSTLIGADSQGFPSVFNALSATGSAFCAIVEEALEGDGALLADHPDRRLLRARRQRPRCRAAEQREELASSDVEHGLLPGTRCASLPQPQDVPEAPAGPWGRPESF
jgi:hypothetical protein